MFIDDPERIDVTPQVRSPRIRPGLEIVIYGFDVHGHDVGLDPNGHTKGMTGPVAYRHVDDINERLEAPLDAGAEAQQPITDVGGGKLIATVKDADGNLIGLVQGPAAG